ncbi:MAG: hypothetical protein RIC35_00865 [Marinoscillum sp.]
MRFLFFTVLLILVAKSVFGQIATFSKSESMYVEVLGQSATVFSVNYSRVIFANDNCYVTGNVGFGSYRFPLQIDDNRRGFNIPVGVSSSFGKQSNHFVVGLGLGLNMAQEIESYEPEFLRFLLTYRVGYKYQRPSGGFFFCVDFTPTFPTHYFYDHRNGFLEDLDLIAHLVGFSLGYTFTKS